MEQRRLGRTGPPVLGGRARRCRLLGLHAGGGRGRLPPRARPRGQPPRHRAVVRRTPRSSSGRTCPRSATACSWPARAIAPNPDGVRAHLERTLERLGCDHLDLYQLHGVTSLDVLDERSAAAEVILAARDEGLTRFVGITGHDLGTPAGPAGGAPPLRPRHRDVPGVPAGVGRSGLPRRRGGAPGRVRRAATSASWPSRPSPAGRGATASPRRPPGTSPTPSPDAIARGIAFALSTARGPRLLHAGRPRPAAAGPRRGGGQRRPRRAVRGTRPWRRRRSTRSSSRWRRRPAGTDGCAVPRRIAGADRAAPSALTAGLRRELASATAGPRCWPTPSAPG